MRKFMLIGLLSAASLAFAGTKSYAIAFNSPAKAGAAQFAEGNYTVKVVGDQAVFTDAKRKSVSVPVKLENSAGKKFEYTSVEATQKDGAEIVTAIHLAGSNTTLEFGE